MAEPCRRCKGEGLVKYREDIGGELISGYDICPDCGNSGIEPGPVISVPDDDDNPQTLGDA